MCLGLSWPEVLLNGNRYQPPVLSVQDPANSPSGLQRRIDVHSFFCTSLATLSFYPSITCHIYFAWLCIVSRSVTLLFPSLLSSLLVLIFTEMYQRIKTCTQLKKHLLFFYFSLFPATCFLSSPCQLIYTMTNEQQRHTMNLKTRIIKIQWDERNRPHICHVKFQLLTLCHSLIYQWWVWILILSGTV